MLRRDLSAAQGGERPAPAREERKTQGEDAAVASNPTSEVRSDERSAPPAEDRRDDAASAASTEAGDRVVQDAAADRRPTIEDESQTSDAPVDPQAEAPIEAPVTAAVALPDAASRAPIEGVAIAEGAEQDATTGARPFPTDARAQAITRGESRIDLPLNDDAVEVDPKASARLDAASATQGAQAQPNGPQRPSANAMAPQDDAASASASAATSISAAAMRASSQRGESQPSAKATPSSAPATTGTPREGTTSIAPAAEGAGMSADTIAKANDAVRALEDAVLAARTDRAALPTEAASRTTDPALARVAAMEADLAAERVAQALGQGLVAFDDENAQTRATGNATAFERRPAAKQTSGADARAMADAMAVDRAGAAIASAASAGSTTTGIALPTAMPQPSIAAGLTALGGAFGGGGPAADLARQPSDGATPAAQLAAKGLGILANQRGGAITMRLEPPALGQLRIQLQVSQGAVVADFTAATAEARALLEANLGMLRERLESQGLSVERITIHGARSADAAAQSSGDQRQDQGGNADARDRGGERRQDAAGGESRGRRDREPGNHQELSGRANRLQGGFASALDSVSMTPASRRSA